MWLYLFGRSDESLRALRGREAHAGSGAPRAVRWGVQEAGSRAGGLRQAPRRSDARARPRQARARPPDPPRPRRRPVALRAPARRPLQPRDGQLPARAARGRAPREGGLPERGAPPRRHRVFRSGRGSEPCGGEIGAPPSAFGVERSASRPGDPCDDAAAESANGVLEREPVRGRAFASEGRLGTELFGWVNRCDNCRPHPTLGCMTPVGFREAGPILS